MTTMIPRPWPQRALSVPWHTRLIPFLGRVMVPAAERPTGRREWHQPLRSALGIVLACLLVAPIPVWAEGKPALPGGVPNLFDPAVRAHYKPTIIGSLPANRDFPLVLLVNTAATPPEAVLVALDARNGSDTWSLNTDPIVLIALFADPATITDLYIDRGLLAQGTPTGEFQGVPDPQQEFPELLHAVAELPARTFL